jgi:ankyrin repeat protein
MLLATVAFAVSSLLSTRVAEFVYLRPQDFQNSSNNQSKEDTPISVPDEEVAGHEIGTHKAIRRTRNETDNIFQSVRLKIIVDADGIVVTATPQEGPVDSYSKAAAEAMTWKYVPFEHDGRRSVAAITDYVSILPLEDTPKTHRDFPRVTNLAGLVMKLSRSGCFGTCPAYTVEIHGDGTVIYDGEYYVVLTGEHRDHISADQVEQALNAFYAADYFSLKDKYSFSVTDCPTYVTSFELNDISKSVVDYVGLEAGMPQSVSDLENTIDGVAGTAKWIRGTSDTVPALKREDWDFKSPEAAGVLARASHAGSTQLVQDLVKEGVSASGTDETGTSTLAGAAATGNHETVNLLLKAETGKDNRAARTEALAAAARIGDAELVQTLLDAGADAKGRARNENGAPTVLMSAASSGVAKVVEMILEADPDVNARDSKGRTAFFYISDASTYFDEKHHANRVEVVHLLAHAGANLNLQDDNGNAPLHSAYNPDIAQALIQDGANVDIRNRNGETPFVTNFSPDIAKLLLEAGADSEAKNEEGKTALDIAKELEPDGEWTRYLESVKTAHAMKP